MTTTHLKIETRERDPKPMGGAGGAGSMAPEGRSERGDRGDRGDRYHGGGRGDRGDHDDDRGGPGMVTYLVFVGAMALPALEVFLRRKSVEWAAAASLVGMALCGALAVNGFARFGHVHPVAEIRNSISDLVDYSGQPATEGGK